MGAREGGAERGDNAEIDGNFGRFGRRKFADFCRAKKQNGRGRYEMNEIIIPKWMWQDAKEAATICAVVNAALRKNPNATLQDFADELNATNQKVSVKRLWKIIERQVNETA